MVSIHSRLFACSLGARFQVGIMRILLTEGFECSRFGSVVGTDHRNAMGRAPDGPSGCAYDRPLGDMGQFYAIFAESLHCSS